MYLHGAWLNFAFMMIYDGEDIRANGMLHGYTWLTWAVRDRRHPPPHAAAAALWTTCLREPPHHRLRSPKNPPSPHHPPSPSPSPLQAQRPRGPTPPAPRPTTPQAIICNASVGIAVSAVLKYCDNIARVYAHSIAMLCVRWFERDLHSV